FTVFRWVTRKETAVKRTLYRERDYTFGQLMLTLRTSIGLTQAGLADLLHISRRAVAEWEAGSSYPRAERLKEFLTLCLQQQAFPAGREEEEIRALWRAAHQKVLFDEPWLAALLDRPRPALPLLPAVPLDAPSPGEVLAPQPLARRSQGLERRLSLLLEELRTSRVLLVLDNLEVLLEEGEVLGRLRPGFEAYGHLLRRVAETTHQSCLLLTSREKPAA